MSMSPRHPYVSVMVSPCLPIAWCLAHYGNCQFLDLFFQLLCKLTMSSLGFSRLSMWQAPEVPKDALIPIYLDNTSKMFLWESLIFFWLMIQIASFVISPVWLNWYFIKLFHQHYLIRASKQSYGTWRLCSFYRQTRVGKGNNCGG